MNPADRRGDPALRFHGPGVPFSIIVYLVSVHRLILGLEITWKMTLGRELMSSKVLVQ
jgi:hypothetical protein